MKGNTKQRKFIRKYPLERIRLKSGKLVRKKHIIKETKECKE